MFKNKCSSLAPTLDCRFFVFAAFAVFFQLSAAVVS